MVGPLKTAPSGFTHLLIAVDKFTKWVEDKPIRKLDGKTSLKFVKDIVVQFGIPHSIITNNGSNLSQGEVEEYCHHNGIRLDLAFVAHPQSNDQVERTNGSILAGIKPHLEAPLHRAARALAEELPSMLWSLRTTPNRSTCITPFFLVYGAEAILPSDVQYDSPRVVVYEEEDAEKSTQLSVDLLVEERYLAARHPPSTSRISAAIIAAVFANAHLKKGTWCYASRSRSHTNYPCLGKDPSSSARLY
jgi:hypothetical protein